MKDKRVTTIDPVALFASAQQAEDLPAPDQRQPQKKGKLPIPAKSLRKNRVQAVLTDDLYSKLQKTAEEYHLSMSETINQILLEFYS